ncbi:hypothetical protein L6452_17427 [Arctium lappa]|uniref:Uncharacterized protein n=1 Tax=Arctium lappa TaxID=4217 RepID=A0ACB9C3J0_ARCLA|nr:hypothetical protein L6452_17427 [Arctium lappa]
MPRKSTRLTKGLVSKYKNTPKEEIPLQHSSDEASIDIKFTIPEGDSREEDLIESEEELESTDINNTQTMIGEDEELGESDEVLDSNELNEKVPSSNSDESSKEVPSVESNEQSKEVDGSMFKEDSLRMARGKAPLTKSLVSKFKSTQKDTSSLEGEIEMNSEGIQSSDDFSVLRLELETLKPAFEIDGNVLNYWAYILNNEEKFKNPTTSSRIFLDVNVMGLHIDYVPLLPTWQWHLWHVATTSLIVMNRPLPSLATTMSGSAFALQHGCCEESTRNKAQEKQINDMRKKYSAKILLSDLNTMNYKVVDEVKEWQSFDAKEQKHHPEKPREEFEKSTRVRLSSSLYYSSRIISFLHNIDVVKI